MESEEITNYRAQVIVRFINIETIIATTISQHYFKYPSIDFVMEVLYDEYCSFALKRRILEKIVPNINQQTIHKLNRLNSIRNLFAHCGPWITKGTYPNFGTSFVPDPKNSEKTIDFPRLFEEFQRLAPSVEDDLTQIYKKLGGQLST